MCYEFSEWSWKLRAAELARKEREAEKGAKKQSKQAAPILCQPFRTLGSKRISHAARKTSIVPAAPQTKKTKSVIRVALLLL